MVCVCEAWASRSLPLSDSEVQRRHLPTIAVAAEVAAVTIHPIGTITITATDTAHNTITGTINIDAELKALGEDVRPLDAFDANRFVAHLEALSQAIAQRTR